MIIIKWIDNHVNYYNCEKKTKMLLEKLRGNMSWDEFLWKLGLELYKRRQMEALKKIRETKNNRDYTLEESKIRLSLR